MSAQKGYVQKNCTEETYRRNAQKDCVEEEPKDVAFFIIEMAYGLLQGTMTANDIYEGVLESNGGNKDVARYIRNRAVEEAEIYNNNNTSNNTES